MGSNGLIYTTEQCVGCNKCVRVCMARGANVTQVDGGHVRISVDSAKCIACGACFGACPHSARKYFDDTDEFFAALLSGEEISLLVAPSFCVSYPDEYERALRLLKRLGVHRVLPVAFGADICTWAYIKNIQSRSVGAMKDRGFISTTCPVIVNYVERFLPELVPYLMPVKSPMMCLAAYCRKELGMTEKIAFLDPCIGKKTELDREGNEGLVQYNLTFAHLMSHARELYSDEEGSSESGDVFDVVQLPGGGETLPGLGRFYPAPGGLAENIHWFLGDECAVRRVEGKRSSYRWMRHNAGRMSSGNVNFSLIDILNCDMGCLAGPASETKTYDSDDNLVRLLKIRNKTKTSSERSAWGKNLTPDERLERLNSQFDSLNIEDYTQEYKDCSVNCKLKIPTEEELDNIFKEMYKTDDASRRIDCTFCGYDSCRDMAVSIFNGFNNKLNCIHYLKDEAVRIEQLSLRDRLTGVMNRNAYEKLAKRKKGPSKSVGVIIGDINGLKKVNDEEGHDAGDRLIINGAKCLADNFGEENVYRIGGDEFLIVTADVGESEIKTDLNNIREMMKERGVSMSLGFAIGNVGQAIGELAKIADAMMYSDKKEHYRRIGAKRQKS